MYESRLPRNFANENQSNTKNIMRNPIKEYEAVQEAAMKFVKSVAERATALQRKSVHRRSRSVRLFGRKAGAREHRAVLPQCRFGRRRRQVQDAYRRGGGRRDAGRRPCARRGLGRPHRFHRLSAAAENRRTMEVRRQSLQPKLEHRSETAIKIRGLTTTNFQLLFRNPFIGGGCTSASADLSFQMHRIDR